MRTARLFSIILISIIIVWSCSTNKNTTKSASDSPEVVDRGYGVARDTDVAHGSKGSQPNDKAPSNRSLADMIRGLYGVTVTGAGDNISIRIGGISSFYGSTEPLFVINGTATSMSFPQLAASINPNEITSITALKGADAGIYGSRGANGVILIRTK